MTTRILLAATCLLLPALYGHHSGALYDLTKTESVKGTVKTFNWTNPHVILMVITAPKSKEAGEEWRFEMTSPARLARGGWTKHSVEQGESVTVEFNPMRDGTRVGWVRRITTAGGKILVFDPQGEEKPNSQ